MRTFEEYKTKLKGMRKNVYIDGKLIERDDPLLHGGQNIIGTTFDAALNPEYKGIATAISHLTGKEINRFAHIYQSADDMLKKQQMIRILAKSRRLHPALHGL
jgi:aromatic ring hydroxylase